MTTFGSIYDNKYVLKHDLFCYIYRDFITSIAQFREIKPGNHNSFFGVN